MTLTEIQIQVKNKHNAIRSLLHLIESEAFEEFFETLENKTEIIEYIKAGNYDKLKTEMAKHKTPLLDMSMRQLKIIAARLKIPNYSRLYKSALLSAIICAQGAKKDG